MKTHIPTIGFRDRREAGRVLASHFQKYTGLPNVVVLALPRGGVPVALMEKSRKNCKWLILARLKNRAADCWFVRLEGAKRFSRRRPVRGVAARV